MIGPDNCKYGSYKYRSRRTRNDIAHFLRIASTWYSIFLLLALAVRRVQDYPHLSRFDLWKNFH